MLKLFKQSDTVQKLFLSALVLGIALYPKFPFFAIPGTSVRVRLEDFLLVTLGLYVGLVYLTRLKTLVRGQLERSIILYFAVGAISLLSAVLITNTIVPHIGALHYFRRIEYFVPLFFALSLSTKSKRNYINFLMLLLVITVIYAFVFGFGQKYFSWPVILTQNEQYSKGVALRFLPGAHLVSTFAGHYDLASFLVLVLPMLILCIFTLKDRWQKILFAVVSACGVWALSGTLSRISIAAYLVSIVVAMIVARKFKEMFVVLIVSMVIFSFSSNLFDRYLRIIEVTKSRLQNIMMDVTPVASAQEEELPQKIFSATPIPAQVMVFEDRSTSIRINVEWPRALRAFSKNPLLGTGFSSITLATDNDYLRLLGEVGMLGFVSFGLILTAILVYIKRGFFLARTLTGVELAFVAGFSGSFFGALINALFIDVFEASKFAILFWLIAGLFVYYIRSHDAKNV